MILKYGVLVAFLAVYWFSVLSLGWAKTAIRITMCIVLAKSGKLKRQLQEVNDQTPQTPTLHRKV